MKTTFNYYSNLGFATLPTRENKAPYCKWLGGVNDDWRYSNAHGIGIICGEDSHNVECIDIDNKFNNADYIYEVFISQVCDIWGKYHFVVEKTINGGYHIVYRSEYVGRNQKLLKKDGVTIIETRGNGGYFCVDPTPGYKIIHGDIEKLPYITEEEREELLLVAENLFEYKKMNIEC